MKFLLIQSQDDAHLYSQLSGSLRDALREVGCEATLSHIPLGHPEALLAALTADRYDAAISFSSSFGDAAFTATRQSIFDALDVKFVGWQFDHPIYVHHALSPPMSRRHSIYPNDHHRRFADAIGVSGQAKSLLPGAQAAERPLKPYRQREWSIFVAATWNGVPQRHWEAMEDSPAKHLLTELFERLAGDPQVSVIDAFQGAVRQLSMPLRLGADAALDAQLVDLFRVSLSVVRDMGRLGAIGALVDAGLPVTLCGSGWREHFGERSTVTFLDSVPFSQLSALYDNAKIVLNLNASNGGCERALYAMTAGAAVVSDPGDALTTAFASGEDIAFFDRLAPESVADVVGDLLQSDRGEAMAQSGYDRAIASALWRHRAETLVEWLR